MGKLYLCRHHVRFADFTAIPGEVVEAELTEAAEKRLLALGALEAVELDNDPDAPQGGPAGENTPGADDAAQEPEDSAVTEEKNTEEEDTRHWLPRRPRPARRRCPSGRGIRNEGKALRAGGHSGGRGEPGTATVRAGEGGPGGPGDCARKEIPWGTTPGKRTGSQ